MSKMHQITGSAKKQKGRREPLEGGVKYMAGAGRGDRGTGTRGHGPGKAGAAKEGPGGKTPGVFENDRKGSWGV